jgi:hypothetical protein
MHLRSIIDSEVHSALSNVDYGHNLNGSLANNANKGIAKIDYNHLDLPEKISLAGGKQILYLYNAAGTKLANPR